MSDTNLHSSAAAPDQETELRDRLVTYTACPFGTTQRMNAQADIEMHAVTDLRYLIGQIDRLRAASRERAAALPPDWAERIEAAERDVIRYLGNQRWGVSMDDYQVERVHADYTLYREALRAAAPPQQEEKPS